MSSEFGPFDSLEAAKYEAGYYLNLRMTKCVEIRDYLSHKLIETLI